MGESLIERRPFKQRNAPVPSIGLNDDNWIMSQQDNMQKPDPIVLPKEDSSPPVLGTKVASAAPLSARAIVIGAIIVAATAIVMLVVLLVLYGSGSASDRAKLDAVRTAGAIVIGTGGAAALLLTARRQRWAELTLEHQERIAATAKAHQERVAAATEVDAAERRITELYTKAADQLGSDKAPVRLAGLYALERLANGNPTQRQTIVSVISAYLRMPYRSPDRRDGDEPTEREADSTLRPASPVPRQRGQIQWMAEERQVRLTAQRILATHLRPDPPETLAPDSRFWGSLPTGDLDVDLTGAELSDFNFAGCRIRSALFGGATFTGEARFDIAVFRGDAIFDAAVFADGAFFERATFLRSASFKGTDFDEPPPLEAEFTGDPGFTEATFHGNCIFSGQPVPGGFSRAKLSKQVVFYPPADLQLPLPSSGNEWFVMP